MAEWVASRGKKIAYSVAKHQEPKSQLIRIKGERKSGERLGGVRFVAIEASV
jgi:hypothetical protein